MITKKHKNTRTAIELLAKELGFSISWWDSVPPAMVHKEFFSQSKVINYKEFSEFQDKVREFHKEFTMLLNYLNLEIQEGKRIIKKPKGRNGS